MGTFQVVVPQWFIFPLVIKLLWSCKINAAALGVCAVFPLPPAAQVSPVLPPTAKEEEIIHLLFQRLHRLAALDWLRQDIVVQSRSHSKLLIKTFQKLIWPLHSTHVIKAPAPAEPALKYSKFREKQP